MTEHLDDRTYDLLLGVRRSSRYHNRHRRFYELWSSVTIFVMTCGGFSAVAASLLDVPGSWNWLPTAIPAIIAAFGAMEVAVGTTARRANVHADLAQWFIALEKSFAHGLSLEDTEFAEITSDRLEIESSEPPSRVLLDTMCHLELLRALGESKEHPHIPWWRRFLANVVSQPSYVQKTLAPRILERGNPQAA